MGFAPRPEGTYPQPALSDGEESLARLGLRLLEEPAPCRDPSSGLFVVFDLAPAVGRAALCQPRFTDRCAEAQRAESAWGVGTSCSVSDSVKVGRWAD